jgi:hypothetical protein
MVNHIATALLNILPPGAGEFLVPEWILVRIPVSIDGVYRLLMGEDQSARVAAYTALAPVIHRPELSQFIPDDRLTYDPFAFPLSNSLARLPVQGVVSSVHDAFTALFAGREGLGDVFMFSPDALLRVSAAAIATALSIHDAASGARR